MSIWVVVLFCIVGVYFQSTSASACPWSSTSVFLLACMYVLHVSRRSKCNPRYLALSFWGMGLPFRCMGGHSSRLRVKVTCVDLDSLAQISHCCSHCYNRYKWVWSFEASSQVCEKVLFLCIQEENTQKTRAEGKTRRGWCYSGEILKTKIVGSACRACVIP